MAKAHYPIINFEIIAKGRSGKKRDSTLFSPPEYKEISKSAHPFVTRVAQFVEVDMFHRAYGVDRKGIEAVEEGIAKGDTHASPKLAIT